MIKRLEKKCSTSKTVFEYSCQNLLRKDLNEKNNKLATKRLKRPNNTKTENRSKTLKNQKKLKSVLGMIFRVKYIKTQFF